MSNETRHWPVIEKHPAWIGPCSCSIRWTCSHSTTNIIPNTDARKTDWRVWQHSRVACRYSRKANGCSHGNKGWCRRPSKPKIDKLESTLLKRYINTELLNYKGHEWAHHTHIRSFRSDWKSLDHVRWGWGYFAETGGKSQQQNIGSIQLGLYWIWRASDKKSIFFEIWTTLYLLQTTLWTKWQYNMACSFNLSETTMIYHGRG